jgi:vacuolar-type H+-ATPase subunit H
MSKDGKDSKDAKGLKDAKEAKGKKQEAEAPKPKAEPAPEKGHVQHQHEGAEHKAVHHGDGDLQTLVAIKDAEAEAAKKVASAQVAAAAKAEKAKGEAMVAEEKSKEESDKDYYNAVGGAEKQAAEKREEIIEGAKGKAAALKGVDKSTAVKILKKTLSERFGV